MNNRLNKVLSDSEKSLLSIFVTAGFPELDSTVDIACSLSDAGVDFIELGVAFSDPIADGKVIQESNKIAIENGSTIELVLEQVAQIRKKSEIPILLMGYFNPFLQFGFDKFLGLAKDAGVDGLIIPDLPLVDFETKYQKRFEELELSNVFLVTPNTSEERIRRLDSFSSGFIYAVSSPSITGSSFKTPEEYLKRLNSYGLKNDLIVGFGIRDKKSFDQATKFSSGGIIGTAFIEHIRENGYTKDSIDRFIKTIR